MFKWITAVKVLTVGIVLGVVVGWLAAEIPYLISFFRIMAAGIILGVIIGKLVADNPHHVKRLLPRYWKKVAAKMDRKQWVRMVMVALWIAGISLIIATVISNVFAQFNVALMDPQEYPFTQVEQEYPLLLLAIVNILPIFEEWVFRGILIDEIIKWKHSKLLAVVLSSVVFAVFHLSNPGTYLAFAVTLLPASILLGLCYLKVGLGGAILAHNAYNSFLVIIGMFT